MKEIILTLQGNSWMATFKGDPALVDALGTDTMPTAFTAAASKEQVVYEISKRNPDCKVSLK